jgi:RNA polymerase sigma factor (sigma-70 family)
MEEASDRELWMLASGGEAEAFGVLFERHARAVYNFCFRRTANWAVAEDLTSVVFLEAWRHRETAQVTDSILPWLIGTATNVVRNYRRALHRYQAALARIPLTVEDPDFSDDLAQRMDDQQTMRAILELAKRLPKRHQDVLFCSWGGLSYEETALALRIPIGTVRSRLARARTRLRKLAGDDTWLDSVSEPPDDGRPYSS